MPPPPRHVTRSFFLLPAQCPQLLRDLRPGPAREVFPLPLSAFPPEVNGRPPAAGAVLVDRIFPGATPPLVRDIRPRLVGCRWAIRWCRTRGSSTDCRPCRRRTWTHRPGAGRAGPVRRGHGRGASEALPVQPGEDRVPSHWRAREVCATVGWWESDYRGTGCLATGCGMTRGGSGAMPPVSGPMSTRWSGAWSMRG